jgi:hypothetical protein
VGPSHARTVEQRGGYRPPAGGTRRLTDLRGLDGLVSRAWPDEGQVILSSACCALRRVSSSAETTLAGVPRVPKSAASAFEMYECSQRRLGRETRTKRPRPEEQGEIVGPLRATAAAERVIR